MVCTAHRLQYKTPNFPKHKYLFYTYAHGMAYSSCSVIVNLICVCVSVWYAPLAFNRGFRTFSGEGGVKVCTIPGLILLIWAICTHLIEDSGLSRGEGGGGGGRKFVLFQGWFCWYGLIEDSGPTFSGEGRVSKFVLFQGWFCWFGLYIPSPPDRHNCTTIASFPGLPLAPTSLFMLLLYNNASASHIIFGRGRGKPAWERG